MYYNKTRRTTQININKIKQQENKDVLSNKRNAAFNFFILHLSRKLYANCKIAFNIAYQHIPQAILTNCQLIISK